MYAWIIWMHVWGCMYNVYVCVYSYICIYVGVHVCVCRRGVHVWVCYVCVNFPLSVYDCVVQRYRLVWWDPDRLQKIQNCVRCGPDTLAIRKSTHRTIQRSIPVRAMKARRRFWSKTASFLVSVCSCAIFLFTVVTGYLCFICIISCDRLIYFTSMITRIIPCDTSEFSLW